MSDELHDALTEMANTPSIVEAMEESTRSHTAMLLANPEWTRPRWAHVGSLVRFFAHGVLTADLWHHGYAPPPGFDLVLTEIARRIQAKWSDEVVQISVFDYEQLLRDWIADIPQVQQWNEWDGPDVVAVSRYSPTPSARDFIDLDALTRNAAMAFLRESDRDEAFDKAFEARWTAEHGDAP